MISRWVWTQLALTSVLLIFGTGIIVSIQQPVAASLLLGALFWAASLLAIQLSKIVSPESASVNAPDEQGHQRKPLYLGIIDFVWVLAMAAALAALSYGVRVAPIADKPPLDNALGYQLAEFLLGWTLDSIFLIGGALAACMAILWAGEIWRQRGTNAQKQYRETTFAAIKMVVAYGVIVFGALVWYAVPLLTKMTELSTSLAQ